MRKIFFLSLYFVINSAYTQNKNLYIIFNETSNNTYLWEREVADSIEIKSFEIKKNIPEEKYLYSLYFKDEKLIKIIKGNLSWNNKGRLTFSYVSTEDKKFRIKKDLTDINAFKTDNLEKIEFSSLRKVVEEADYIYILIDESPKKDFYTAYSVKP